MFYLGLNYLDKAVATKRNLLGKCLIAVPQHLDHVDSYLHKGNLPDEKYRFPWKRAKTDDQYLIQESTNIIVDAHTLANEDLWKKSGFESFQSEQKRFNTSLAEAANFDLECDFIPSSNPSTDDLFSPDDFFLEQSIFQETFEKENLTKFSSTCDSLKIEIIDNAEERLGDTLISIPDLARLASRLKAVQVKDPLLLEDGQTISEKTFLRDERMYCIKTATCMLERTFDSTLVSETFKKIALVSPSKKELEEIEILNPSFCGMDVVNLMKGELLRSVTIPKTCFVLDDEPAVSRVVSKDMVKQDQMQFQNIEKMNVSSVDKVKTSFLELNEIVVTEQDCFCERVKLDIPVVDNAFIDNYTQQELPLTARKLCEVTHSKTWLLNDEEKQNLTKRVWLMNKYCDEIQASRLPEPELSENRMAKEKVVNQALRVLKVETDNTIGRADLELKWNIVKYTEEITDPCNHPMPFVSHKECDVVQQVKNVEVVEKYDQADLYVSKDEELLLDDSKEIRPEKWAMDEPLRSKPHPKTASRRNAVSGSKDVSDPLGDFMALRSQKTSVNAKNEEVRGGEGKVETTSKQVMEIKPGNKQNFESKKRVKHHVVEIQITEKYQHILSILEKASENPVHVLKQEEEISPNSFFKTLTPETTRFLLKQREKYLLDHKEDGVQDEVYRLTVILHGLVVASEMTVNCCLESAIGYLSALQEKYSNVIGGSLDGVRQNLFALRTQFHEQMVQHPKVMTLCKEVETWLKKKRVKARDSEQKILVLVKREMPSLLNCLKDALGLGGLLSPSILSSTEPENIIESLDNHNCVIACTKTVSENFPWAQFSLVVEYENEMSSPWQQLCERQNIRHIGLKIKLDEKHGDTENSPEWIQKYPDQQICLIGSEKVTKNTELLQLLESRHNILMIERDYSLIGNTKHLFFPDLDVDVNSAIFLEDLKAVIDDCVVQSAVTKMVALSLKYTRCWIILFSCRQSGSYHFPGHVISNLNRLQAAVSNFAQRTEHFYAKVLYCEGNSELSCLIRNISEECLCMSKNKIAQTSCDREWLTNEITKEEKFLLMLPCLNSMSAQLLMKRVSLIGVFTMSLDDLSQTVPEIPRRTLKMLKYLVQSSTGLHLREFSEVKSRGEHNREDSEEERPTSDTENSTMKVEYEIEKENTVCQDSDVGHRHYGTFHDAYTNKGLEKDSNYYNGHEEMSIDLYIPEDFQNGSQRKDRNDALSDDKMPSRGTLTLKEMNETRNSTVVAIENNNSNQHIGKIPKHTLTRDSSENRDVNNTKCCFQKSGKGTLSRKLLSEETLDKKNKSGGWESLDQFISDNASTDIANTQSETEREILYARKLNPVEKLQLMRQCEQVKRTKVHGNSDIKYEAKDIVGRDNPKLYSKKDESIATSVQNVAKTSHEKESQAESRDCNSFPECQSSDINEDYRKIKSIRDMYHRDDLQNCNTEERHQEMKTLLTGKETFEYNHGLPLRCSGTLKEAADYNERKEISRYDNHSFTSRVRQADSGRYCGTPNNCVLASRRIDLEKEFPPAEEIDRSVSFESEVAKEAKINTLQSSYDLHDNVLSNFSTASNFQSDLSHDMSSDRTYLQLCSGKKAECGVYSSEPNDSLGVPNDLSNTQTNSFFTKSGSLQKRQFDFNPRLIDNFSSDVPQTMPQVQIVGQDLYLNPKLDRISHKIYVNDDTCRTRNSTTTHTHSLEDDLRETTKKLLANSRQFSSFDINSQRRPLKKVSIGLAQPQLRNKKGENSREHNISDERQRMMAQSPWATEDSPPMDLEYDNNDLRRKTSNRVSYTNQTPCKRMKLTYKCVPGKKGQTQLIFK